MLCELGEEQIGVQRHRAGAARPDRAGVGCEAQDPNGSRGTLPGLYVANSGPGVRAGPRDPSTAGGRSTVRWIRKRQLSAIAFVTCDGEFKGTIGFGSPQKTCASLAGQS
jgi:hypothetical protein